MPDENAVNPFVKSAKPADETLTETGEENPIKDAINAALKLEGSKPITPAPLPEPKVDPKVAELAAKVKTEAEKVQAKRAQEKEDCLVKALAILKTYGSESNIPVTHEYWDLMNKHRSL